MVSAVQRVKIADPPFTFDKDDPDGFRGGMFRFGSVVGAEQLGTSVYELPPGQSICPYHYEYAEEEWLVVLVGKPDASPPGRNRPARSLGRRLSSRAARRAHIKCGTTPRKPCAS